MSQIVNWEYYSSLYSTFKEDGTEFDRAEGLAEKEICAVIGPIRWATITEETFGYEQLKDCICKVMDKMAEDDKSGKGSRLWQLQSDH